MFASSNASSTLDIPSTPVWLKCSLRSLPLWQSNTGAGNSERHARTPSPLPIRPVHSQSPPQLRETPAQGVVGYPPERSTSDISVPRPDAISCRKPHDSFVSVACAHGITAWTGFRSAGRFLTAKRAGLPPSF